MKKYTTLLLGGLFLMASSAFAQDRYFDEVFNTVDITSDVEYGKNYTFITGSPLLAPMFLDVYEPNGDTITERPLIIMAHAGSFLPKCVDMANQFNQLPLGDKEDSSLVEMCNRFAKRGYVAVSMDYRLGWNPISTDADVRAGSIMQAVYRSLQDMKAAVRYFKANAAMYKIDTNRIVVGGSNSGGYVSLAYGALNDTAETQYLKFSHSVTGNPYIDMDVMGDWDGRGGDTTMNKYPNPGPSSTAHMTLNLGGAMADTNWQEAGEIPIVSFHGVEDALTPYETDVVIVAATGQSVIEVSGSHDLSRYATALGNQAPMNNSIFNDAISQEAAARTAHDGLYPFPGLANGYEPWAWYDSTNYCAVGQGSAANPGANKTKAMAYIDTIMGYFCPRAVEVLLLPGNSVGISESAELERYIDVYPNPASNNIFINSDFDLNSVMIYDVRGKLVYSDINTSDRKLTIDASSLNTGMYIISLETAEGMVRKKIMVE